MREDQLQEKILELCGWYHLKVFHVYDSRKSAGPGFPDLVITGPGGTLFAELKSDKGRVSLNQEEWIDALRQSGQHAVVWRPTDWAVIQHTLDTLSKRRD